MQYFYDMGRTALGSRLKRLSNMMMTDVNELYQTYDINIEASLFPLLSLIKRREKVTLREAEEELSTSHAYISQSATALKKKGLIDIRQNPKDKRSKIMVMTKEGKNIVKKAEPFWIAIDRALAEMLHPMDEQFFTALKHLENATANKGFLQKTIDQYNSSHPLEVNIVEYSSEYKDDFERLNREWLDKFFEIEDIDRQYFENPEKMILENGGFILFALINNICVGTCAMVKHDDIYELCKTGIDPRYRGLGIGEKLIKKSITMAQEQNAKAIFLRTHSKLESAVKLYKKLNFTAFPMNDNDQKEYARCNMRMELNLQ